MPRWPAGTRCCTRCGRTTTSASPSCGRRRGESSSSGPVTSTRSCTSRTSSAGQRSSSGAASATGGWSSAVSRSGRRSTCACRGSRCTRSARSCTTPTDPAAAIVSIDPKTGAVKAMVDYLPSGQKMQFNLATQAHRSTGSSFKPITLATASDQGVSLNSTFYGPPRSTSSTRRARRTTALGRPQLRRRGGRHDEPPRRDGVLGEHDLRAAHREDRAAERQGDGAQPRDHEQRELLQARVCHHARLASGSRRSR